MSMKVVVVGNGGVGKSVLVHTLRTGEYPEGGSCITTTNTQAAHVTVDGVDVLLSVWDTAGEAVLPKLRTLTYPETDAFVLCYAVDDVASLRAVQTTWLPELKSFAAPIVLVGTKAELKVPNDTAQNELVMHEEADEVAREIGAVVHLECSSLRMEGVNQVFDEAVRAAWAAPNAHNNNNNNSGTEEQKRKCTII